MEPHCVAVVCSSEATGRPMAERGKVGGGDSLELQYAINVIGRPYQRARITGILGRSYQQRKTRVAAGAAPFVYRRIRTRPIVQEFSDSFQTKGDPSPMIVKLPSNHKKVPHHGSHDNLKKERKGNLL